MELNPQALVVYGLLVRSHFRKSILSERTNLPQLLREDLSLLLKIIMKYYMKETVLRIVLYFSGASLSYLIDQEKLLLYRYYVINEKRLLQKPN